MNQTMLLELVNKLDDIILIIDKDNQKIEEVNTKFVDFFNLSLEEFNKKHNSFSNLFLEHKDENYIFDIEKDNTFCIDKILRVPNHPFYCIIENFDKFQFHFRITIKRLSNDKYLVILKDVSTIVNKTNKILEDRTLLNQYKKIIDVSTIVSKTDAKGIITYANDVFCEISGYKLNELIGKPHNIVRHSDMSQEDFKNLWKTIKSGNIWRGQIKNLKKNGEYYVVDATISPIYDANDKIVEYIAIRKDITTEYDNKNELETQSKQILEQNIKLQKLASFDGLTDSYNRRALEDIFKTTLEEHINIDMDMSVIMIDLDHFKNVNDNFGHDAGDNVLTTTVFLIKNNLKKQDIVARYGGEEFIVLLPYTSLQDATIVAEHLRILLSNHKFDLVGNITASFGVSSLKTINLKETSSYENIMTKLIKVSDENLYLSKHNGRNKVTSLIDIKK